ncbi:MAG: hypothetical protein ACFNQB_07445 [Selenomonas noxia]
MTRKNICSLACLCLLFLVSSGYGICSATENPQEAAVSMSSVDLTRLKENSAMQAQALSASARDLEIAHVALNESNKALKEARQELTASEERMRTLKEQSEKLQELLRASKEALMISQRETLQLSSELSAQRSEIAQLKQRLMGLGSESENAASALRRANESLQSTRLEFQKNEQEHARREKQLKNKITVWQIIAVILGGVALGK